jgi:MSHA biogenesis protein MshG
MGTMIKSGVPLMEALRGIQNSSKNRSLIQLLRNVCHDLDQGMTISETFSHHPDFFNDYYVSMVKVGEESGRLEEIFALLYQQLLFERQMSQKTKSALRYPYFVLISITLAIAIMVFFVIPVFSHFYASFNAPLPLLTRTLLNVSAFFVHYSALLIVIFFAAAYAFRRYIKCPEGRYNWGKLKLKLPFVGPIIKKATLARFCRSLAIANQSGVPIIQSFTLVSRVVDNAYFEKQILAMRDGVTRGESLLIAAQSAVLFTPLELQMIAVGEMTGEVDEMLKQVADLYQDELEYEISRLNETIEPLLLSFMGVLVLIVMLGIFLPIWRMGATALGTPH